MLLMEAIRAFDARISGGSDYQWHCFGDRARFMEFVDRDGLECGHIVYDTQLFKVYEMCIWIPGQNQAFRWMDSGYTKDYIAESKKKKVDPDQAWDDVKWAPVDENTALKYAQDIGGTYYDDLPVPEDTK